VLQIPRIIDDVIRVLDLLFRRHLRPETGLDLFFGQIRTLPKAPLLLFSGTRDDNQFVEIPVIPRFDHQGGADNADAARILRLDLFEPFLLTLNNRRVHQAVELCAGLRIIKDDFTEDFTIDGPIRGHNTLSERLNYSIVNGLTRLIELVADRIRIDQVTSELDEHLAHCALACGDSTGEPDPKH